jgi:hypothetical protein
MSKKVKLIISIFLFLCLTIKFGTALWGIHLVGKSVNNLGGEDVFKELASKSLTKVEIRNLRHFELGYISIGLPKSFSDDGLDEFKPKMHSFSDELGNNLVIANRLLEDINIGSLVSKLKRKNNLEIDFVDNDFDLFSSLINLRPNEIGIFSSPTKIKQMLALLQFRMIYINHNESEFFYFRVSESLEVIQLSEGFNKGRVLIFNNKKWLAEVNYDFLTQQSLYVFLSNLKIN